MVQVEKLYVHIGDTAFSVQLSAKLRIIPILWKLNVFYAIALGNTFIGWILTPDSWTKDCTGTNVSVFKAQNAFWCNVISPFWTALWPDGPFHSIWHHRSVEQGLKFGLKRHRIPGKLFYGIVHLIATLRQQWGSLRQVLVETGHETGWNTQEMLRGLFFFPQSSQIRLVKTWLCAFPGTKLCICPSQTGK